MRYSGYLYILSLSFSLSEKPVNNKKEKRNKKRRSYRPSYRRKPTPSRQPTTNPTTCHVIQPYLNIMKKSNRYLLLQLRTSWNWQSERNVIGSWAWLERFMSGTAFCALNETIIMIAKIQSYAHWTVATTIR